MKITELLDIKSIALNVNVKSKEETIDCLVDLMDASGKISDKEAYKKGILAREELSTTGIGDGIAIPHAQVAAVKKPGLAAITIKDGVDYESLDGSLVHLAFMIAAPEDGGNLHLQALAKLSTLLMNEDFRKALINASTAAEFLNIINEEEAKKDAESTPKENGTYRVLAVTACPTGIAHTFMAAENLTKAGKEMGYLLKAETNGADGAKNVLTAQEIAMADGIIIAADKKVEMSRFDGKPVLSVSVTQGIQKPEELINKIINHEVPVYHHDGSVNIEETSSEGIGRAIYKHLMNGVSHMLPFVIGGGILIALAFLFDDYSIDPSNFGKNTPLAAYLKTIGEQAFGMMLPVLAGYVAMSIADRPGLAVGFIGGIVAKMGCTFANPAGGDVNSGFLGALLAGFIGGYLVLALKKLFSKLPKALEGIKPILIYPVLGILLVAVITTLINPFVGAINTALNNFLNSMGGTSKILLGMIVAGMQSTDMGGPINKASYVFATSQLAEGNFEIMAAVMAGGMIPPLAIALSTTLFKNRWTKEEKNSGLVNYVMGLAFISEGAIPFAAKDPLRVIPSCIIGSAIAGGLSMLFGCTLRAPHGGIFVLPTIGNPLMYALAIVLGAVAGCLVLSILKKPLKENN
ncbi:PTS fructose transporter subunit IIABC [Thomasclavelia saccharogumia]|uniref:PTS fructose transporter subunit IIABC n=1 Tax=Thomasclavelia saccharogumia TaxID=341225 RepID=UPI00047E8CED|nr:fructose-specific PTS transporter subunit EIIC [Thomasclavelia saccharogumia]